MSMLEWARREVELACIHEKENSENEGDYEYGCRCYKSALKAFECLCEDDHSGYSIEITKDILNRLIDAIPLTPATDSEDSWNYVYNIEDGTAVYQSSRMSGLFKHVKPDGDVTYHDVNRYRCVDTDNVSGVYLSGFVSNLIDEMYPISMPYIPESKPIIVTCKTFLLDPSNGDFDHRGILLASNPNTNSSFTINRYFKETSDGWKEISYSEFYDDFEKSECVVRDNDGE